MPALRSARSASICAAVMRASSARCASARAAICAMRWSRLRGIEAARADSFDTGSRGHSNSRRKSSDGMTMATAVAGSSDGASTTSGPTSNSTPRSVVRTSPGFRSPLGHPLRLSPRSSTGSMRYVMSFTTRSTPTRRMMARRSSAVSSRTTSIEMRFIPRLRHCVGRRVCYAAEIEKPRRVSVGLDRERSPRSARGGGGPQGPPERRLPSCTTQLIRNYEAPASRRIGASYPDGLREGPVRRVPPRSCLRTGRVHRSPKTKLMYQVQTVTSTARRKNPYQYN